MPTLLASAQDFFQKLSAAPALTRAFAHGIGQRLAHPREAPGQRMGVEVAGIEGAERFPRYYLEPFHGQPNGYLSAESARIYDLGQELIFLGALGLIRRGLLRRMPQAARRILDLGSSTGGSTFPLAERYLEAEVEGIDLSPFFLARARERAERLGLSGRVSFRQENAEDLSCFAPGSFDLVSSTFLHHEVPLAANRRIFREAARLLAPGGSLAILDELQSCDSRAVELVPRLAWEPHYAEYNAMSWPAELEAAGFCDIRVEVGPVSKTVVARKAGAREGLGARG